MKKTNLSILLAVVLLFVITLTACQNTVVDNGIRVGDSYFFGRYEQDNNTSNGKESIEWIVIDKVGNKLFLLSKKVLDFGHYHNDGGNSTWEHCTLRKWLNNDFYNSAFNSVEQYMILTTKVEAILHSTEVWESQGNDTNDKVFILSCTELERYFDSDEQRKCLTTYYSAYKCFGYKHEPSFDHYWARGGGDFAAYCWDGRIDNGLDADSNTLGIRPAIWIIHNFKN